MSLLSGKHGDDVAIIRRCLFGYSGAVEAPDPEAALGRLLAALEAAEADARQYREALEEIEAECERRAAIGGISAAFVRKVLARALGRA